MIVNLILSFIIGFTGAYLSRLIDFSFNTGNLLDWYYIWLLSVEEKYPKLAKPLGKCIKCMSIWVTIIVFLFFNISFPYLLISIAYNYYLITK